MGAFYKGRTCLDPTSLPVHNEERMMARTQLSAAESASLVGTPDGRRGDQSVHEPSDGGWDELIEDDKSKREAILNEHFPSALKRYSAGVSLAQIRRHYEKLGAKYSPVTFRKKWDLLANAYSKHS